MRPGTAPPVRAGTAPPVSAPRSPAPAPTPLPTAADFDDADELTRLVLPAAGTPAAATAAPLEEDPLSDIQEFAADPFEPTGESRQWDVASDELGDPFATDVLGERATAPATPEHDDVTPPAFSGPLFDDDAAAEFELTEVAPPRTPAPAPSPAAAPMAAAPPELSGALRDQVHGTLEKIAWEALGDVSERIVKEAVARIEQVAWDVIPRLAETLIREEIRKLKGEE